jgi:tetratricopeptide (TPR) repeat protein
MADALIQYFRHILPAELAASLGPHLQNLEDADFEAIFRDPLCKHLLGHEANEPSPDASKSWNDFIFDRLEGILTQRNDVIGSDVLNSTTYKQHFFFLVAVSALGAFLQSNVTGPPLPFSSARSLFLPEVVVDAKATTAVRHKLLESLKLDGEAPYRLTPHIELLSLADTILTCPPVLKNVPAARWARLRVDFLHQRILSEISPTLERDIYASLDAVRQLVVENRSEDVLVPFLLEAATIHTFHGYDRLAKEALEEATEKRHFEFAITGLLGKRTKFQQKDTSQLVVLAKSTEAAPNEEEENAVRGMKNHEKPNEDEKQALPKQVDLNDDTLLESISFTKKRADNSSNDAADMDIQNPTIQDESTLPSSLAELDPEKQPQLHPLDSIILLSVAASITNTNPADGLTREETAPYATRVLEGGSSNWQVYTQALLLRSRIEGYKSRTVERGLLQLQALVDQVIADTGESEDSGKNKPTTFLPKATEIESAPASQRLLYIYALCSPTRWELEAELAARWVNLGGLRSALEIYERLEMWAEAALCWAATERDDKARRIIRKQLFHATAGNDEDVDEDTETWSGSPRYPPPSDSPRLYCLLGDIDKDPSMYEKAWTVSNEQYSRAQRSLGRYYYGQKDYAKASLAFSKSLRVKALDHGTWFALGCALLELQEFKRAVEAFSRAVQIDHDDAESWSNMAAALLNLEPGQTVVEAAEGSQSSSDTESTTVRTAAPPILLTRKLTHLSQPRPPDPQKNKRDALKALKQAARLKHDNHRIWDNLLTVSASLSPPSYPDVLNAQSRIIELRGPIDGEKCIDVSILSLLVNHIITTTTDPEEVSRPGLPKMVVHLVEKKVVPLITSSAALWRLVAKLALWRNKPSSALEADEKAWRVVVGQPGWEHDTEGRWDEVVDATLELVGAYESLGMRTKTEGLAAGGDAVSLSSQYLFQRLPHSGCGS